MSQDDNAGNNKSGTPLIMPNEATQQPVIDTRKVETLRAQIHRDDYTVNTTKIASKVIALELALPRRM